MTGASRKYGRRFPSFCKMQPSSNCACLPPRSPRIKSRIQNYRRRKSRIRRAIGPRPQGDGATLAARLADRVFRACTFSPILSQSQPIFPCCCGTAIRSPSAPFASCGANGGSTSISSTLWRSTASIAQGNLLAGAIVAWLIHLGDWIRDLTAAGSQPRRQRIARISGQDRLGDHGDGNDRLGSSRRGGRR